MTLHHTYHMTRVSANSKLGPIPATTTSKNTCPTACSFKGNGCYAESGPLAIHWHQLSIGNRGVTLDELCGSIRKLPKGQLWRWAQAGDLPGDGVYIDGPSVKKLVDANVGRNGFGFTHYNPALLPNRWTIAGANLSGFTLNMSAETLEQADYFASLDAGPVVVVLPIGTTKPLKTPGGRHISVCPAVVRDDVQCANCGICANPTRKAIVGFPAHGSGAKKAQAIFFQPRGVPA